MKHTDFNWTEQAVIGLSLLMMHGSIDSFGDKISGSVYYYVGKHKKTGQVAIVPKKETND